MQTTSASCSKHAKQESGYQSGVSEGQAEGSHFAAGFDALSTTAEAFYLASEADGRD